MENIAKNEYYELSFDAIKNQILWTMLGFWNSMDLVPNFFSDWDKVTPLTKSSFTILAHLSNLSAWPKDVFEANMQVQAKLMKKGCRKVAVITQSVLIEYQIKRSTKEAGMIEIVKIFDNIEDAKAWLDE